MPLNVQERFGVQTLIQDAAAGLQSLSESVLITNADIFTGDRYRRIGRDDYSTLVPEATYPEEFKWLQTYFGQELKPLYAGILYWKLTDPAETISTVIQASIDLGIERYVFHYVGKIAASVANQTAIAQAVEALEDRGQFIAITQDPNALLEANATDIGSIVSGLSLDRTTVIFHPTAATQVIDGEIVSVDTSDDRPDAAIWGRMATTTEGASQFDFKGLNLVNESNLTSDQRTILANKGYNWVEQIKRTPAPYLFPGRTCTGREIRIQWGADWFDLNVQSNLATFALQTDLMAFDDDTFIAVEAMIRDWGVRAINRRIILDDLVVDLPDPDTVSAAVRASGIAAFNNVYSATLNSAIDGWQITGNWSIGGV